MEWVKIVCRGIVYGLVCLTLFRAGMIFERAHSYGVLLVQWGYKVGFRDGIEKQLVLDKHLPTRDGFVAEAE